MIQIALKLGQPGRLFAGFAVIFLVAALFTGCQGKAPPEAKSHLRIAAASDLKFCLDEITKRFEQTHPQTQVSVQFGSSGSLFAQIVQGAPFDLFLSADSFYPDQLREKEKTTPNSIFPYAIGHLVLWVPRESPLSGKPDPKAVLSDPNCKTILIANPRHAPYGRAAEAALKSMGLYDSIQARLVNAENVAQAAQHVSSGSADAGLISLATAQSPQLKDKGTLWRISGEHHPVLLQSGAILKDAREPQTARQFADFLTGPEGSEILKRYGFTIPGT